MPSQPADRTTAPEATPLAPPVGMRDLLPPEASARRRLVRRITDVFARWGYALVVTPPFEQAQVIERAEGTFDPRDHLRFVDADTGEVALLRPDITPQIARVVATRLADRPPPIRLSYEGHVVRRRRGRARRQRQIAQVGVECLGVPGEAGDAEVVTLAAEALDAVGLRDYRIELALVPLVRSLLASLPPGRREDATEALAKKDRASLERLVAGAPRETRSALVGALDLAGDARVLDAAARVFGARAQGSLRVLRTLTARLFERGLGDRLLFDLGEVRGFGYYTGPSFSVLAAGPGEPIGSGGRYDALLGRFGRDLPATGFALDVGHLDWALEAAGRAAAPPEGVAVVGRPDEVLIRALRERGLAVTVLEGLSLADAEAWAVAWGVRFVVDVAGKQGRAVDRAAGGDMMRGAAARLVAWIGERTGAPDRDVDSERNQRGRA